VANLDGGRGRDILIGGFGDDDLIGGSDADTFHFNLAENQGTDTIIEFERKHDIIDFSGIVDRGSRGLVDDLDAISTISDLGAGNDLVVELVSGSSMIFAGLGIGDIDSWGDIVSRPFTQLTFSTQGLLFA
jgi:Ca2+-binding RTX toxin-like protein